MLTVLIVAALIGAVAGFYLGRRHAEHARGRYDARQAYQGRNRYRRR